MPIEVSIYEKSKEGEKKLIIDIFELVRNRLGEKHENDSFGIVLQNEELFRVYLDKYQDIKQSEVFIEKDDNPCGEIESVAIENITEKVKKRVTINRLFSLEEQSEFPGIMKISVAEMNDLKNGVLSLNKIRIVKNLKKEQVDNINLEYGPTNSIHKTENVEGNIGADKVSQILGEFFVSKEITLDKIKFLEELDDSCYEKIVAIGGKCLALKDMSITKIKGIINYLTKDKINAIGSEWLAYKGITNQTIKSIKDLSIEKIEVIGGENFASKGITISKIENVISNISVDDLKENLQYIIDYEGGKNDIILAQIQNSKNVEVSF